MDDVALLNKWINPLYLAPENIAKIQQVLSSEGFILLENFFADKQAEEVFAKIAKAKLEQEYIPDMRSYKSAQIGKVKALDSFLSTPAFRALIGTFLDIDITKVSGEIVGLEHGSYTLLHDAEQRKVGTFFCLDFTQLWDDAFGGSHVFMDKEPLLFSRSFNTLILVQRDVYSFIKYVNGRANKNNACFIQGSLE